VWRRRQKRLTLIEDIREAKRHRPYWNVSTAPRHVWLGADDAGASAYFFGGDSGGVPPWEFTERSVFLQHLGLHLGSHRGNPGSFAVGRDINIAPEGVAAFVPRCAPLTPF